MSKQKNTVSPHDAFFKKALQNPHMARHFLEHSLSAEALALIRLETLEPQNVELIDEDLKKTASDVIFRVKTIHDQEAYIYLLLEHQRKAEKLMPFRLLKYMVRLIDLHLTKHKTDVLPLVIPLVVYNGDTAYSYSMDLFDLFSPDTRKLARNTLVKPYPLIDLSQLDTREVKDDAWVSSLFNALKYGPSKKTSSKVMMDWLEVSLVVLAENGDLRYIQDIIYYLCEVKGVDTRQEFWQEVKQRLQPILGENFMISIADAIRQEGMQQGMQQGEQLGLQKGMQVGAMQVAKNFLASGFDLEIIAKNTGLSMEVLKKLEAETKH